MNLNPSTNMIFQSERGARILIDEKIMSLNHNQKRVLTKLDESGKIYFLGMDSENSGRTEDNLLITPVELHIDGEIFSQTEMMRRERKTLTRYYNENAEIESFIEVKNEKIIWSFNNTGSAAVNEFMIVIPFNPLYAATAIFPGDFNNDMELIPPWMLVVPDYGHAVIDIEPKGRWTASVCGTRGGSKQFAPESGVDIKLKGEKWIEAAGVDYRRGVLKFSISCKEPISSGETVKIIFSVPELKKPDEIDKKTWIKIRRPYLNVWQPCSNWAGNNKAMVLANNVLSDPAACSLWYYSEPMLFYHEPVEGFDMRKLLRHSLDYYLNNYLLGVGNVIAFGKHDMYIFTNANLMVAVWDYWKISNDLEWLEKNIKKLNLIADYLIRRDIDDDGIIESYGSGKAKMLRHPDRADVWWEMVNFNWKNAWTNAHAYRAFLCFAEILEALGKSAGASRYREAAERIKKVYFKLFFNPETGWIGSWVDIDGKLHDYCYTPINGVAVAYGLVPPEEGKKILLRIIDKLREIGFDSYHLGVPLNLIPIHPDDRIQPLIDVDGNENPAQAESLIAAGNDGNNDFGRQVYNGSISPCQTWHYILALQETGLDQEADKIINAMIDTAAKGLFQNGILNVGYGGAEHLRWDGKTCGYEGYLADMWVFLTTVFTRNKKHRDFLLGPLKR